MEIRVVVSGVFEWWQKERKKRTVLKFKNAKNKSVLLVQSYYDNLCMFAELMLLCGLLCHFGYTE